MLFEEMCKDFFLGKAPFCLLSKETFCGTIFPSFVRKKDVIMIHSIRHWLDISFSYSFSSRVSLWDSLPIQQRIICYPNSLERQPTSGPLAFL